MSMKQVIRPLKGTRDFYPEEMAIHQWLQDKVNEVSQLFGYEAWDGPFLESLELYAAKSGEELVKEQAFCFEDRGGDFITLRPELTPTLARMVAQKQQQLFLPLRWYSFGPFWRYERPQRGRTREFFQWNIDMIGLNSDEADAELIAICASFFTTVGLSSDLVKIKVNDRQLMNQQLDLLHIPVDQHGVVFRLIDRKSKLPEDAWRQLVLDAGLSEEQCQGIVNVLEDANLWQNSPSLVRISELMEAMGYHDYIEFDTNVIRGLDYYTGVVFEAVEVSGGRAILGGGHYDNLVGAVGGDPMPGVGFAMGDVMIKIVLEDHGLLPQVHSQQDSVLVTVFDESMMNDSFRIAARLRKEGIKAVVYPETVKLMKQFKYADRKHIHLVIVRGPDEAAQNTITIKNLETREQVTMNEAEGIQELKKLLAQNFSV